MWGDEFGMCVDQFGVSWMVNISQPPAELSRLRFTSDAQPRPRPPSTTRRWPVTKAAPSEAKKLTAWAISSGVPKRPAGTDATYGAADVVGDVGVAFDRDEARGDRVDGDAVRRQLRAQLRVRPICALLAVA